MDLKSTTVRFSATEWADSIHKGCAGSSRKSDGVEYSRADQILAEMYDMDAKKIEFVNRKTNKADQIDLSILRFGHVDQLAHVRLPDEPLPSTWSWCR